MFPRPSLAVATRNPSLLKAQWIPVSSNSGQRARAARSPAAPSAPTESAPKHLGRESHIRAEESRASDTCIKDNSFLVKRPDVCHFKVSHGSHIPTTISTKESTNAPTGALAKAPIEAHLRELRPRGVLELLPRRSRDLVTVFHMQFLAAWSGRAKQAKALSAKTNITKSVSKDWRSCPSARGSGRGRRGAQPQPRCLWTRCRSTFRAGTPRHENVKNWRLLAAKSTQNLCTPRTPELPSEAPREAHLRELRPLRPVHELLPRRSRNFAAAAHDELLAARAGIGLVLPPPSNTREGKFSRHHSKGTCEDGGQRHRAFEPATWVIS